MACATCDGSVVTDYPSILGRNITGRSRPGEDVRYQYQNGVMVPMNNQIMNSQPKKLAFDWGSFAAGFIVGGILVLLFATATGRGLVGAAGERATRYVRGR